MNLLQTQSIDSACLIAVSKTDKLDLAFEQYPSRITFDHNQNVFH